ncbi:hypothetical protein V6N13_069700 [Hibiscus sabdariffa]|uniref:Uncharacterized protein n=1 Tax=Hibiscus sabdariffa TaxID=183260 RepID=A0ABR2PHH9_9ROSI
MQFPALFEQRTGFRGFFWKAARIGERLSPWVAVGCFTMGVLFVHYFPTGGPKAKLDGQLHLPRDWSCRC